MKILITQPTYLPWLGFIDKVRQADIFAIYDTAQYCKNDFYNRNRIRAGDWAIWLTVPVHSSGFPALNQVQIDNSRDWRKKHLGTIRANYCHAPQFDRLWPDVEHLLNQSWDKLIDLQLASIEMLCRWFNIQPKLLLASQLAVSNDRGVAPAEFRNLKLVEMCKMLGADTYISGAGARCYLDESLFAAARINVEWHEWQDRAYPQQGGGFVPQLSSLDLAMNVSDPLCWLQGLAKMPTLI